MASCSARSLTAAAPPAEPRRAPRPPAAAAAPTPRDPRPASGTVGRPEDAVGTRNVCTHPYIVIFVCRRAGPFTGLQATFLDVTLQLFDMTLGTVKPQFIIIIITWNIPCCLLLGAEYSQRRERSPRVITSQCLSAATLILCPFTMVSPSPTLRITVCK